MTIWAYKFYLGTRYMSAFHDELQLIDYQNIYSIHSDAK